MSPDQFNACFEALGGLFVLDHCRATIRARAVAGVSVPAVLFFIAWGGFNLYYYSSLGQTFSFFACIFALAANLLWVALILHFRKRKLSCRLPVNPD
jgi:hypothetical protein